MQVRILFDPQKSPKKVWMLREYSPVVDRMVQKRLKNAGTYRKNLSYKWQNEKSEPISTECVVFEKMQQKKIVTEREGGKNV